MRVWRISNYADLSGRGGELAAGRWNSLGTPIVYCADHPAAALLEILVHVDAEDLPARYQLLEIDVPEAISPYKPRLSSKWRSNLGSTRKIGSAFVEAGDSPVMQVPSVVVPFSFNLIINPRLAENHEIRILSATKHPFDSRLLRC